MSRISSVEELLKLDIMSSSSGSIIRGMRHLGQSEILSTPAAAPLASSSLQEAKLRARRLFREVRVMPISSQ